MKMAGNGFLSALRGQGFGIAILACAAVAFAFPKLFISWGGVVEKINRIAAGTKYSISDFSTGVLKEPHNLTQIFPKLSERRSGLNVKA